MKEIKIPNNIDEEMLNGFEKNRYFEKVYNHLMKDDIDILELIEFGLEELKKGSSKLENLDELAHYFLVLSEIKKFKKNIDLHSFLVDMMVHCENTTNTGVSSFKSIEEIENAYKNIKKTFRFL